MPSHDRPFPQTETSPCRLLLVAVGIALVCSNLVPSQPSRSGYAQSR